MLSRPSWIRLSSVALGLLADAEAADDVAVLAERVEVALDDERRRSGV